MMNKKLIALLIAVATVAGISADYGDCWIDENGYKHCKDVVEPVRATGEAAGEAVGGAADVTFGTIGGLFGGRGVKERMEDREDRREQRRAEREQRRAEREERRANRKK